MKYCPKCRCEYRDDAISCSDCGLTLLEAEKDAVMKEKVVGMKPVKIYSASDKIQAEMIMEAMRRRKIPCFSKGVGSGDYLTIYQGFSVYGEDIFVDESDVQKAMNVIENFVLLSDAYTETEEESEQLTSEQKTKEQDTEEEISIPWYRNKAVIARILVIYVIAMMLFTVLFNLLN